jgi:LysM repeat protein
MYFFYFKEEGEEELPLPVSPANISFKVNNKNKTVELLDLGEINILKEPGLIDISFKVLLPSQPYPFALYPNGIFRLPEYYLKAFERYKYNKKKVNFCISRIASWNEPLFDTNLDVSLERYTLEEDAKSGNDVYVSLELKEYKEYHTKILELQQDADEDSVKATIETQRPAKVVPLTYTVKSGDTLWAIAKKNLNNGSRYKEIAITNGIANPNLIYPDQVLKLP